MEERPPQPRLPVIVFGETWVLAGVLLPALIAIFQPSWIDHGHWLLTSLMVAAAIVLTNLEFRLSPKDDSTKVCPIEVPIVIAALVCGPWEAMVVALAAQTFAVRAFRDTVLQGKPRLWIEGIGMSSMSALAMALLVETAGANIDSPLAILISGIAAAAAYSMLDALSYVVWMQAEAGEGAAIVQHFVRVGPLQIAMAGTLVVLAAPFADQPWIAVSVIAVWQIGIVAYYQMSTSEHVHREQSQYLRGVFSRYVPESVADQLSDSAMDVQLGGETREVSVLFCDIRGFTAWSEQHEAETVIAELNVLLSGLTEAVMRQQGTLDKFTGDGLMAFWGAPLEQPDHAVLACRAAADIHEALHRCNEFRAEQGMPGFAIGVGIASGPAVIGNIGHERRLDYTAIGDTVNLAARLEAATKELGAPTVISEPTYEALDDATRAAHAARALRPVQVKGKVQPVASYGLFHAPLPADVAATVSAAAGSPDVAAGADPLDVAA